MATLAEPQLHRIRRHRFYLISAFVMTAVIISGFAFNLAMGRSSFGLPPIYHIHAFIFFAWVALYLTQNILIGVGSPRLHRTLGWVAVVWVPMMVVMGTAITLHVIRTNTAPPFFDAREFLLGNPSSIACFAALAFAAIAMRRKTPWHRRLMFCAMAILTGPGFGRLLPAPLLIPWAWTIAAVAMPLLFPLTGVAVEFARTRHVHPAWLWGIGAVLGTHLVSEAVAFSPIGTAATRAAIADTPTADRSLAPHFP